MVNIIGVVVFFFVTCQQIIEIESSSEPLTPSLQQTSALRQQAQAKLIKHKYESYLSFEEMEERLRLLQNAYPNKIVVEIAGKSVEGRNLYVVTVKDTYAVRSRRIELNQRRGSAQRFNLERFANDSFDNEVDERQIRNLKPVIFVDAGIHAREWVAPASAFYAIDQLVKTPSLTADLEWRIMPIVNPDGYVYSQSSQERRFWRKNRAATSNQNCVGVDLNRNFDVNWEDTNHNPCDETYSGESVFSEPEAKAVRDALKQLTGRTQAYITIHTYGQYFLHPYGYSSAKSPPNVQKLKAMGQGMANVIRQKYGNEYEVQQASIFGDAAGGSDDWAFVAMKVPYSYTFELQTKASFPYTTRGFELDPWKLPQAVDECWLALRYLGEQILKESFVQREEEENPKNKMDSEIDEPKQHINVPISITQTRLLANKNYRPSPKPIPLPIIFADEWSRILSSVNETRLEMTKKNNGAGVKTDCVKKGPLYVCPHMVFWGSMFNGTS